MIRGKKTITMLIHIHYIYCLWDMFEAASFADASFSPKNRFEAGGCKVISHKENTI